MVFCIAVEKFFGSLGEKIQCSSTNCFVLKITSRIKIISIKLILHGGAKVTHSLICAKFQTAKLTAIHFLVSKMATLTYFLYFKQTKGSRFIVWFNSYGRLRIEHVAKIRN